MKSIPVTSAQRREIALLKVLKKRADRMQDMHQEQRVGSSIARIARRHRLTPAKVRALLKEYLVFAEENSLGYRIRYQKAPYTLRSGDKSRYRAYCRVAGAYSGTGSEYQGPAPAATLHSLGLRLLVRNVLRWRRDMWEKL